MTLSHQSKENYPLEALGWLILQEFSPYPRPNATFADVEAISTDNRLVEFERRL